MSNGEPITLVEQDVKRELDGFKEDLLPLLLPLLPLAVWLWGYYLVAVRVSNKINPVPFFALIILSYLVWYLRRKHYLMAVTLLLLGLISAQVLLVMADISPIIMAFGVLVIIVANALTDWHGAFLVAIATWGAGTAAHWMSGSTIPWYIDVLILYLLVWAVLALSKRPLQRSIMSALEGWTQARQALTEVRQRRAEVYSALRSLEEATYRIERLNNELILAQRDAEAARANKARFVAAVSHELRNPLNLILGFSRMIMLSPEKYGDPLPAAYRADIDAIYRNSQYLAALVDDVLNLSQIEAGQLRLVKDRISLYKDIVERVIDMVMPLAKRKGLTLSVEAEENEPWILADPVRLRQVMLNLLTNAVRFTKRGGIKVRLSYENGYAHIQVEDTGLGIPPEEIPKLFREFSQLEVGEGTEIKGSGLGLSISKQLVDLHKGTLWAESKLGEGTTFHVLLPLPGTDVSETVSTTPSLYPKPHDLCLILHEDAHSIRTLARLLGQYRVIGASTEEQAISLIEELHPRAVLTTPRHESAIKAWLDQSAYDVPLISCLIPTMFEGDHLEGVIDYLLKPVTPEMVNAVMKTIEANRDEVVVLLVDDDPDAVLLLEAMLQTKGHSRVILKAYDAVEALKIMEDKVLDVVFLDLLMPGMDGEELVARMRGDERLKRIPVVIVSAKDSSEAGFTIETPISVYCVSPLEGTRAATCLVSLLDSLRPRYVAGEPPQ